MIMRNVIRFWMLLGAAWGAVWAQPRTLPEVIRKAKQHAPQTAWDQSELRIRSAQLQQKQAYHKPQITAEGFLVPINDDLFLGNGLRRTAGAALLVTQPLFQEGTWIWPPKSWPATPSVRAAEANVQVARTDAQLNGFQVAMTTSHVFYDVWLNQELAALQTKHLGDQRAQLKQFLSLQQGGRLGLAEVAQQRALVAQFRADSLDGVGKTEQARLQLAQLSGISVADVLALPDTTMGDARAEAGLRAQFEQQFPVFSLSETRDLADQWLLKEKQAANLPTIRLFARVGTNEVAGMPDDRNVLMGAQVSWALWDQGIRRNELRVVQAQAAQHQADVTQKTRLYQSEFETALAAWKRSRAKLPMLSEEVAFRAIALTAEQDRFTNGRGTLLALHQAQIAWLSAQIRQTMGRYETAKWYWVCRMFGTPEFWNQATKE